MKINNRHIAFVDAYYSNGFNATLAYQSAFQSEYDTARANGHKLLMNADIRALMEEKQAEIRERANIKKEDILTLLMNIAYDPKTNKQTQIKAVNEINRMLGYQAPKEQVINMNLDNKNLKDLFKFDDDKPVT